MVKEDKSLYQEAFNKAVAGLAGQKFLQSKKDFGNGTYSCMYNGEDGRHCAYYFVNPDAEFVEGARASGQPHNAGKSWSLCGFYDQLQCVHDKGDTPSMMMTGLRTLAREYDLEIPEVLRGPVT